MADEQASELQRAVERLTATIDQLRHELVRKDVYESDQRGRDREVNDLRDDLRETRDHVKGIEDKRAADRRLLMSAFVLPVLLLLVQLYLTTFSGAPT